MINFNYFIFMKVTKNVNYNHRSLQETLVFVFKTCDCKSVVCLPTDDYDEIKINFITDKISVVHRVAQFCENSLNIYFQMSGRHTYNVAIIWDSSLPF